MKIAFTATVTVTALFLAGCNRLTESRFVGTWRAETDKAIDEIALDSDHTYRHLLSSKVESTTPSPIEETGKWQVKDGQLHLDGTVTWAKQPMHTPLRLLKLSTDELVVRGSEARADTTFMRLHLPTCPESAGHRQENLIEKDLLGTWRIHYNTHEYEYSLNQDHSFSVAATTASGEHIDLDQHGTWQLLGNDLVLRFEEGPTTSAGERHLTVLHVGEHCIAIRVGDWSYTLMRLK